MKSMLSIGILVAVIILAVGCATNPNRIKIPKDATKMDVDFSWEGIKACTHESPEIRVSNVPDGTEELRVKLKDIDVPAWNHGGGRVRHDGSGIIPAGALNIGYNGPCPPDGRHKYEFSVMAVNTEGVIIGFGKDRQSFPPKK
ncbi:MAG: phospholipid-binding protein [Desulfosarcina sp.]|nr:phospholipid-binding protein [Desulfosarcina sp.]MBC2743021.1 phospholipid-binding protein [Desulfosarcina sp.]MBC2765931.1 phospholipid-binding protein [Desulfosarcina sp.]